MKEAVIRVQMIFKAQELSEISAEVSLPEGVSTYRVQSGHSEAC